MSDIFRQGNLSFEEWVRSYDLSFQDPEDKQRFQSNLAALQRNSALTFLLNKLESRALERIGQATSDAAVLEQHRDLQAIRGLRQTILAFVDDRRLDEQKTAAKPKK